MLFTLISIQMNEHSYKILFFDLDPSLFAWVATLLHI